MHHIKPAVVKGNVYMCVSCHTHIDMDTWRKTNAHLRFCNSRCATSSCKYMGFLSFKNICEASDVIPFVMSIINL